MSLDEEGRDVEKVCQDIVRSWMFDIQGLLSGIQQPQYLFYIFHWILSAWPGIVMPAKVMSQTFKNGAALVSLGANRISEIPRKIKKVGCYPASTKRPQRRLSLGVQGTGRVVWCRGRCEW